MPPHPLLRQKGHAPFRGKGSEVSFFIRQRRSAHHYRTKVCFEIFRLCQLDQHLYKSLSRANMNNALTSSPTSHQQQHQTVNRTSSSDAENLERHMDRVLSPSSWEDNFQRRESGTIGTGVTSLGGGSQVTTINIIILSPNCFPKLEIPYF